MFITNQEQNLAIALNASAGIPFCPCPFLLFREPTVCDTSSSTNSSTTELRPLHQNTVLDPSSGEEGEAHLLFINHTTMRQVSKPVSPKCMTSLYTRHPTLILSWESPTWAACSYLSLPSIFPWQADILRGSDCHIYVLPPLYGHFTSWGQAKSSEVNDLIICPLVRGCFPPTVSCPPGYKQIPGLA